MQKIISSPQSADRLWDLLSLLFNSKRWQISRSVKLTTHIYPVRRINTCAAILDSPLFLHGAVKSDLHNVFRPNCNTLQAWKFSAIQRGLPNKILAKLSRLFYSYCRQHYPHDTFRPNCNTPSHFHCSTVRYTKHEFKKRVFDVRKCVHLVSNSYLQKMKLISTLRSLLYDYRIVIKRHVFLSICLHILVLINNSSN